MKTSMVLEDNEQNREVVCRIGWRALEAMPRNLEYFSTPTIDHVQYMTCSCVAPEDRIKGREFSRHPSGSSLLTCNMLS